MNKLFLVCIYSGLQRSLFFCEAVLLVHHKTSNLYLKLKEEFTGQDPFETLSYDERKLVCDEFLRTNVYHLSTESLPLPIRRPKMKRDMRPANYQILGRKIGVPENLLGYREKMLTINSTPTAIRAFPCAVSRTYIFYLTYGFKFDYLFVIVKLAGEDDLTSRLWAVITPEPVFYSSDVYRRDYLNDYFWNFVTKDSETQSIDNDCQVEPEPIYFELGIWFDRNFLPNGCPAKEIKLVVPKSMEFESLSDYQHFLLCASVGNELEDFAEFHLDVQKINTVATTRGVRNLEKAIIKDDGSLLVYAESLPCAINREWGNPQFYLLRDPGLSAAVFVLRPRQIEKHGEVLWLEARMDMVVALF